MGRQGKERDWEVDDVIASEIKMTVLKDNGNPANHALHFYLVVTHE